jgi:hypothetical protein
VWPTHGVARAASVIIAIEKAASSARCGSLKRPNVSCCLFQSGNFNTRKTAWKRGSLRKGS